MAFNLSEIDLFDQKADRCKSLMKKIEYISYVLSVSNFLSCRLNY
jgi:hypothetical protein